MFPAYSWLPSSRRIYVLLWWSCIRARLLHHAHSKRLEYAVEARGDLGGHFLLNLKPFRIDVHETDKLGNSHNPLARQIADVNAADDRRYVVFAMRFEPDVAQQDDLVVAGDFFEGPLQV